ncbi:MAG: hypothetical protein KY445_11105, partial [Armatimonadetes bacterium]|nr:hypothetical protein [Armatimonadota bacterium]
MAKNRNRRDEFDADDQSNPSNSQSNVNFGDDWAFPETQLRSTALLDEILEKYPPENYRARQTMLLLRHQLETDERQMAEAAELVAQY